MILKRWCLMIINNDSLDEEVWVNAWLASALMTFEDIWLSMYYQGEWDDQMKQTTYTDNTWIWIPSCSMRGLTGRIIPVKDVKYFVFC